LSAQTTLVVQPSNGLDCLIDSRTPNVTGPNHSDMMALAWTVSGVPTNCRGLIDFDLSAIPQGAVILSAEFSLFVPSSSLNEQHSSLSGPNISELSLITSPWNKNTANWNNQPNFSTVNQVIMPQTTSPNQY
jgi:hypothetical protein